MEKSELISMFKRLEEEYKEKRTLLDKWKASFEELSQGIERLSADFDKKHSEMTIIENLPSELKEKLENRQEGVRLSVKTASRLQRKLNIEKPIEEGISEFILWEDVSSDQDRVIDSEGNELSHETEQSPEESIGHLEEVSKQNEETLEQVKGAIEAAEKRFVTFIEKALAPVMDGLYSGDMYAKDLIVEVTDSYPDYSPYVTEWLTVYTTLMSSIKKILDQFSVGLLIPETGQFFNEREHEPLVIVEDPSMENEQIKEVIRYGYFYQGVIYNQEGFIIRPAQVSVVKNANPAVTDESVNDTNQEDEALQEPAVEINQVETSSELEVK
ncbi:nucleotide exchange factor GrpE [Neobacillus drentensis]|uniref:nucleotide exchange factor GrpE n=1 Tax=Neobacillus drentensis TaxID=220684 RepID=UPI002FFDCA25